MARLTIEQEQLLRALIRKYQLTAAELFLLEHTVECCPLFLDAPEDHADVGNSRYGGVPDLPVTMAWPRSGIQYCTFLMQINMSELPPIGDSLLPKEGLLYCFLESEQPWTCQVLFFGGSSRLLQRAPAPPVDQLVTRDEYEMRSYKLRSARGLDTALDLDPALFEQFEELTEKTEWGDVWERLSRLRGEALGDDRGEIVGQLLGRPTDIGGNMREAAYLTSIGEQKRLYDREYRDAHAEHIRTGAKQWRQLWRIDSNFKVDFLVGDAGSIYILARESDLARHDFSRIYAETISG
jgi:uncharacterized protein YwqG